MNWDDPSARHRLIERVGIDEYERQFAAHLAASTVATVNGHAIRPVGSRFGQLFAVGATGKAYKSLEDAKAFAMTTEPA